MLAGYLGVREGELVPHPHIWIETINNKRESLVPGEKLQDGFIN